MEEFSENNINHYCDLIVRMSCSWISKNPVYFDRIKNLLENQGEKFGDNASLILRERTIKINGKKEKVYKLLNFCKKDDTYIYTAMNSKTDDICAFMVASVNYDRGYVYVDRLITKNIRTENIALQNNYSGIGTRIINAIKEDFNYDNKIFGITLSAVPTAIGFYKKVGFKDLNEVSQNENDFDKLFKKDRYLDPEIPIEKHDTHMMVYYTDKFKNIKQGSKSSKKLQELAIIHSLFYGSKDTAFEIIQKSNIKPDKTWKNKTFYKEQPNILLDPYQVYYFKDELNIEEKDFNNLLVTTKYKISPILLLAYTRKGLYVPIRHILKIFENMNFRGKFNDEIMPEILTLYINNTNIAKNEDIIYDLMNIFKAKRILNSYIVLAKVLYSGESKSILIEDINLDIDFLYELKKEINKI